LSGVVRVVSISMVAETCADAVALAANNASGSQTGSIFT
jgi:hypothetical protein